MVKIAVLVSGSGTNLQALIDAQGRGELPGGELSLVVASKPGIYSLERAQKAGIPSVVLRKKDFASQEAYDNALIQTLEDAEIGLVVLAGFLTIIGEDVYKRQPWRPSGWPENAGWTISIWI